MSTAVAEAPTAAAPADHPGCLYCGGRDLEPLYSGVKDRLGHVPGERTFLRCRGCGSAVLDPLPRSEELPGFYPDVYTFSTDDGEKVGVRKWLSRLEYQAFYRPQYRAQVRQVLRGCGWADGKGRRLLDVGCGRGLRLLEFRRHGFDVHGLDLQPQVVRYLRDRLNIPADCADVSEMTRLQPAGSFDLVTAFFLIEHVPDVRATLTHMRALAKPGGWVAFAVPFLDSPQARLLGDRWASVTEAPRHISLPTRAGVRRVAADVGLEDVRILPDAVLSGAAHLGLSLFSGAALTNVYGGRRAWPFVVRAAGAAATLASIPWSAWESAIGRPSNAIVVGRKPAGGGA